MGRIATITKRSAARPSRRSDRLALELRFRGFSYPQIAKALNLTTTTAQEAVYRAAALVGQCEGEVLMSIAKAQRCLLDCKIVDLRSDLREFNRNHTPSQLLEITQQEVRQKLGRSKKRKTGLPRILQQMQLLIQLQDFDRLNHWQVDRDSDSDNRE